MDEETRAAFEGLATRLTELTAQMNNQFERMLNRLNRMEREASATHTYLLEIMQSHGVRLRDIERRLDGEG